MFRVSIMETTPHVSDKSAQKLLSGLGVEGLIKYRKEIQWSDITSKVEELESKFDYNPDGSKAWERFVNEPIVDQCGQVWMIWKNGDHRYQIYVIPPDAGKFKYVIVDYVSTTSYPEVGFESSQFSVGFDKNREPIILNIVVDDKGGEYCHLYNQQEEIERAACRSSGDIKRGIGTKSVNAALVTVA